MLEMDTRWLCLDLWLLALNKKGWREPAPLPSQVGGRISPRNAVRSLQTVLISLSSRTGKLVMGILALIAEFENDIRRERQMDGIAKSRNRGVKFGRKPQLLPDLVKEIQSLRAEGITVPQIMRQTKLSRASIYRALGRSDQKKD